MGAAGTGPISLTGTLAGLTQNTANSLTGTNSLTISAGTATLSVANNYTGGTSVAGTNVSTIGTTVAGSNILTVANATGLIVGQSVSGPGMPASGQFITAINGNTITITSGTGVPSATTTLIFGNGNLVLSAAGALPSLVAGGPASLPQTGGMVAATAANALSGPLTLNLSGGVTNISAAQSYTRGANITGTNVTIISASGALSGTTTVSGGGTLASGLAATTTGITNFSGGTIALNAGGILSSAPAGGSFWNVGLNSGGIINPGGVGIIGTGPLTINNLTTASGGILQFDTATGNSADQLTVGNLLGGTYSFGAGTVVTPLSFGQFSTVAGT